MIWAPKVRDVRKRIDDAGSPASHVLMCYHLAFNERRARGLWELIRREPR